MAITVEATYENGVLKPSQDLTIQPVGSSAKYFCGSLRWTRDREELRRHLNDPDESSLGGPLRFSGLPVLENHYADGPRNFGLGQIECARTP